LHDGVEFERRERPACVIVTEPFQTTADLTAKMAGMPGYTYAVIPHPISRLDSDALRLRAEAVADRVVELLLA
jgi:hypothetical protein